MLFQIWRKVRTVLSDTNNLYSAVCRMEIVFHVSSAVFITLTTVIVFEKKIIKTIPKFYILSTRLESMEIDAVW